MNHFNKRPSFLALPKTQYQNYYFVKENDGTDAVIVEWTPPDGEYDAIHVQCPSNNITFDYFELQPVMYVKCAIVKGVPFNVAFWTAKNGYERVPEILTGLLPSEKN